jgi:hypothetical protein
MSRCPLSKVSKDESAYEQLTIYTLLRNMNGQMHVEQSFGLRENAFEAGKPLHDEPVCPRHHLGRDVTHASCTGCHRALDRHGDAVDETITVHEATNRVINLPVGAYEWKSKRTQQRRYCLVSPPR